MLSLYWEDRRLKINRDTLQHQIWNVYVYGIRGELMFASYSWLGFSVHSVDEMCRSYRGKFDKTSSESRVNWKIVLFRDAMQSLFFPAGCQQHLKSCEYSHSSCSVDICV